MTQRIARRASLFGLMALSVAGFVAPLGCVVPLAPDFEPEQNQPPFLVSVTPPIGAAIVDPVAKFEVTVEDPNRTDDLYLRWLIDYPPFNQNVTRNTEYMLPSSGPGSPNQHVVRLAPRCDQPVLSPALTTHRLMLVVSDRPFDDSPAGTVSSDVRLDKIATDGYGVWAFWTFEMVCPQASQ